MSAILSADDLNDFITPGVACIKPVETLPATSTEPPSDSNEVILDGTQDASSQAARTAQISLTDCLACSGCVTSAEAVLVSLQSHNEVLSVLDAAPALELVRSSEESDSSGCRIEGLEKGNDGCCSGGSDERKIFVATVSPQAAASLAAAASSRLGVKVTAQEARWMVERLFSGCEGLRAGGRHGNGFHFVVDERRARDACLVLGRDEILPTGVDGPIYQSKDDTVRPPVLTSACPGWVCYAEKTHPHVLPHLSRVKSPQALMGTLLKTTLSRALGISPSRIWHLAVMPCFDKKLEASREELTDTAWAASPADGKPAKKGVRDVDCVITTREILMLAESRGIDFFRLPRGPPQRPLSFPDPVLDRFLFPPAADRLVAGHRSVPEEGTSGGMLHFLLESVCADNPGSTIQSTRGRNADVVEYSVAAPSGEVLFKAARFYGFRNIQNLVRKMKPPRPSRVSGAARRPATASKAAASSSAGGLGFAYVEVMACPGGCTNGGGQIKVDDEVVGRRRESSKETKAGPQEQKEWLAQVDEAYFSSEDETDADDGPVDDVVVGISPSYIRYILEHWSRSTGISLHRLVYTTYREVISDVGKNASHTEKVVQIASKVGGGW